MVGGTEMGKISAYADYEGWSEAVFDDAEELLTQPRILGGSGRRSW